jgi:hypothetical protein
MVGHHDRSMKLKAPAIIMQAMMKHNVSGVRRKWLHEQLAERHKVYAVGLLVMRQFTSVFIHPLEREMFAHGRCDGRSQAAAFWY